MLWSRTLPLPYSILLSSYISLPPIYNENLFKREGRYAPQKGDLKKGLPFDFSGSSASSELQGQEKTKNLEMARRPDKFNFFTPNQTHVLLK